MPMQLPTLMVMDSIRKPWQEYILPFGPMAFSQADFSDSSGDGHEHDIHDPDAAP
jgi:hypothetical protein